MGTYISFDWAVKKILRQKENFVVLEGLLSVLLEEDVKIQKIIESESNKETEFDKFNRVDLLAKNSKGELIIVEVQNSRQLDYFQRMFYGTSKVIIEHMKSGYSYAAVKKVYSVNIVYFEFGHGNDYVYKGTTEFHSLHNPDEILGLSEKQQEQFMKKNISHLFPEFFLLRVNDFDELAVTPLDEWILFLKTSKIPEKATAPGLQEARTILNEINMNESERIGYENHRQNLMLENSVINTAKIDGRAEGRAEGIVEGRAEGIIEGEKKGRAEGILEGKTEIVLKMWQKLQSVEEIHALTDIPIDTIEEILKQNKINR
ncbi:MAG: Rpn family recombination-promoting nuclease/putative transposase [Bacteroidales bacterium]|nr:Rpn family recombination-promoting nuclease/putative transposase [Bacteroidales bacterium]